MVFQPAQFATHIQHKIRQAGADIFQRRAHSPPRVNIVVVGFAISAAIDIIGARPVHTGARRALGFENIRLQLHTGGKFGVGYAEPRPVRSQPRPFQRRLPDIALHPDTLICAVYFSELMLRLKTVTSLHPALQMPPHPSAPRHV
jgi:hypothetical protein